MAPALIRAAVSELQGILHLVSGGGCSWYEFGRAIISRAGLSVACDPISSEELKRPARRPAYSVLDTGLADRMLGIRMPDWREALAACFEEGSA
jgi:dTDP-4-dehydrorhamnose reductase